MIRTDTVRTRVEVDGKQAVNELGKLDLEMQEVRNRIKEMKAEGQKTTEMNKSLKTMKERYKELQTQVGAANMTMRQLGQYQKQLRQEYSTAHPGTKRYIELQAELRKTDALMAQHRQGAQRVGSVWSGLKKQIVQFGMMAASYLGATALIGKLQNLVTGSAELSDAMSDVQKTTGLTKHAVEDLMSSFRTFNTRTPRMELLGMAEVAGRLGIKGKKDIEGFVRAADQINVALGDVLGDAETVMKDMGKLTDTYGIQTAYGIEQAMLKVGSSINELGMASTANERNIVDFTRRLAGVAPIAGVSIQNIMGMGATLDALGQTVEVSGTAISRLFIEMAKNADKYAKFAKMEVADFVKLLKEDANEAFVRMLEGVKDNSDGITELAGSMGDLGLDGARVIGVFANLANNTEKLREQQALANRAFAEGTSVTNEFALKNENLAANLSKVQKWFNAVWMNGGIRGAIESTVGKLARYVAVENDMIENMKTTRVQLDLQLTALRRANIPAEERAKIIRNINSEYKDYLPNLLSEKATVQEIGIFQKQLNDHLLQRIVYMAYQEEIQQAMKDELASQKGLVAVEINKQKVLAQSHKMTTEQYNDQIKLAEDAERFNNMMIDNSKARVEGIETTYEKLAKRLGTSLEQIKKAFAVDPVVTPTGEDDDAGGGSGGGTGQDDDTAEKLQKAIEDWRAFRAEIMKIDADYAASKMEKDEQEFMRIFEKYNSLKKQELDHVESIRAIRELTEEETAEHHTRLAEIEDLKREELNAKRDEHARRDAEIEAANREKIRQAGMTAEQHEIEQTEAYYRELIDMALLYGMEITELTEMREMALAEIRSKYYQQDLREHNDLHNAKAQVLQAYSQMFGAAIDLIGNKSNEMNSAQKTLALFQIAADTAMGIMKAQVVALQAAAAGGPAAPVIYAATKASILASIFQGAARAKALLTQGRTGGAIGTGGGEGGGSMTIPNMARSRMPADGPSAQYSPQIPNYTSSSTYTPNVNIGNSPSSSSGDVIGFSAGSSSNSKTPKTSEMEMARVIIDELRRNPLKSTVVYDDYKKADDTLGKIRKDAGG